MGILDDLARVFPIFTVIVWVVLIMYLILTEQIVFSLLLLFGLIIPLSFLVYDYRKNFREFECKKYKHHFKVTYLRLLFTPKFEGKNPALIVTAIYKLKCPKCGNKSWLVPFE
jgi:hypothetical protein